MRKMKDSGIEWIGEIPEDWEVLPFRHVLQERNERNNPVVSEERLSLSIERGVTLYADKTTNLDRFKDDFAQYKLAYIGDLVMNSMNMIVGATGVSKWFGCVSPVYYTFYDNDIEHTTAKFCEYIFRSKTMLRVLHSFGKGIYSIDRGDDKINTCRLKVAKSDLKNIKIPIPQISEQKLIIQLLDKKCSEIDSVISKTRETIEEYKKLKQSIITEVVTGKVKIENGKVCGKYDTYKDSGVEWIGEIPSEWEVKPIKALFSFGKGLPITKDNLTETGLSVISYGQIHSKDNIGTEIRNELIRYVDKIYYETNPQSLVHKGDFIFADTSEDLTGCGNFVYVNREKDLFAGYHTIILFSKEKNDNKYLAYLFQTDCWRRQIRCCCSGVKLFSISRRILGSTNLILPSILEQQQISDFLDKKCSEIDKLITKKEQLVVELEAYKKSLIYEVVTGKRGVRGDEKETKKDFRYKYTF